MKRHLIFLGIIITQFCMAQTNDKNIALAELEGTWYVNYSNFKMWLKGDKHNPTFDYKIETKKNSVGLKDIVSYTKNKKPKTIVGFDKPTNLNNRSFIWRGKGLLSLFKSKWEIVYNDNNYTIIHFQKTLFTAEGFDVISRNKNLDQETVESVKIKLIELKIVDLTKINQN